MLRGQKITQHKYAVKYISVCILGAQVQVFYRLFGNLESKKITSLSLESPILMIHLLH